MSTQNPWKTLRSREVYRNKWLRLREDNVVRPDGTEGIYSVLELPSSAGIVALDAKQRVLLVGQWRYPNRLYSWEIPTGGMENSHEKPIEGAKRELLEETGYVARRWRTLGFIQNSNGATTDVAHLFLATELRQQSEPSALAEGISSRWVPFDRAIKMVMSGRITESCSVAALLKAAKYVMQK